MTMEALIVTAILGLMAASVIAAAVKKKDDKPTGCESCPNYHTCRAHIGCSNNTSRRSK